MILCVKICVFIVVNQRNVCLIAGTGTRTQHSNQVRYCVHLIYLSAKNCEFTTDSQCFGTFST